MQRGVFEKSQNITDSIYEWDLEDRVAPRLDGRGPQEAQRADGWPRVRDPREADVLLGGGDMHMTSEG